MLNAAYRNAGNAASDVLGCRVRDGVAMTASWPSPIAESASRTIDTDAGAMANLQP
jgi:hypothetical protein